MPASPTPLDAPPTAPNPDDRTTFDNRAHPFFSWFATFRTQIIALATNCYNNAVEAVNAAAAALGYTNSASASAGTATTQASAASASAAAAAASAASAAAIAGAFVGTSATSLAVGTGTKVFTTQTGEQYSAGIWMTAVSQATPSDWMFGQVISYSGSTLTLDVQAKNGTATHADWNLSLTGARGVPGTGVTDQAVGWTATGGTTAKTLTVDADVKVSDIVNGVYGGTKYLGTIVATGAPSVDIEWSGSAYDEYVVMATGVYAASGTPVLSAQLKVGGSYLTTATYNWGRATTNFSAAEGGTSGASATSITLIANGTGLNTAEDDASSFVLEMRNVNSTTIDPGVVLRDGYCSNVGAGAPYVFRGAGFTSTAGILSGIHLFITGGTITGTFKLYGIKMA